MPAPPEELRLAYAEPGVRTAPRRTMLRVLGRWIWNLIRAIISLVRALLLGLGYLVLGATILVRVVLLAVARTLLFMGRWRWNRRALVVWTVRTFNRATLRFTGLFLPRSKRIPLTTPDAAGNSPPSLHVQPTSRAKARGSP